MLRTACFPSSMSALEDSCDFCIESYVEALRLAKSHGCSSFATGFGLKSKHPTTASRQRTCNSRWREPKSGFRAQNSCAETPRDVGWPPYRVLSVLPSNDWFEKILFLSARTTSLWAWLWFRIYTPRKLLVKDTTIIGWMALLYRYQWLKSNVQLKSLWLKITKSFDLSHRLT